MRSLLTIFKTTVLALSATGTMLAQTVADNEPADLDTELAAPAYTGKKAEAVSQAMISEAKQLIDRGYNVELMLDDQVIAVTIQLDRIFSPNAVTLMSSATPLLDPFTVYTRHYGKYKLLLAVHSDDTGSPAYRTWLCEQRILSLYDFFDTHGSTPAMVYGYPLGHDMPLVNDDSRANRALNRRLEIYIVPGPEFINSNKTRKNKR